MTQDEIQEITQEIMSEIRHEVANDDDLRRGERLAELAQEARVAA